MESIVIALLEIQDQLQVFHFQTRSYARHKALGKTYEAVAESSDAFIETAMGKYGRFELGRNKGITLVDYSEEALNKFISDCVQFLKGLSNQLDPLNDSDLLNIRDDMLGSFNRLRYLLTLS